MSQGVKCHNCFQSVLTPELPHCPNCKWPIPKDFWNNHSHLEDQNFEEPRPEPSSAVPPKPVSSQKTTASSKRKLVLILISTIVLVAIASGVGIFIFLQTSDTPSTGNSNSETVLLTVHANVVDAEVSLNSVPSGLVPLEIELAPGTYAVRVTKEGYGAYETSVDLVDEEEVVEAQLTPLSTTIETSPSSTTLLPTTTLERATTLPTTTSLPVTTRPPTTIPSTLTTSTLTPTTETTALSPTTLVPTTLVPPTTLPISTPPQVPTVPRSGQQWIEPTTKMPFVWIPSGCFQMGSPETEKGHSRDEEPRHRVCIDGIWVGKHEVTNAQFRRFRPSHNSREFRDLSLNGREQPAVYVSWQTARDYAQWLSRQNNKQYRFRLLTEAEWEYACRAGTTTSRFWGEDPNQACRYASVMDTTTQTDLGLQRSSIHQCNDRRPVSSAVGQYQPNPFGLHDMLGNVWEWVEDRYSENAYSNHSPKNPMYRGNNSLYSSRGGSWYFATNAVRCAQRHFQQGPTHQDLDIGFRLVRLP